MGTAADTLATANELGQPRPLPKPQSGALTAPSVNALAAPPDLTESPGVDALATPPPMGQTMARNTVAAGQVNHGDPRDWAENAIAGVQSALAGFGAAGKVPEGAGAAYGVGAAMRQQQEAKAEKQKTAVEQGQRQQQIDLEKQRVTNEQTNSNREYDLKLAENARQQAQSIREMSDHDARLRAMDDEHKRSNYQLMHEDLTFRQSQLDHEEALNAVGAKPVKIAGQEAPEFDDLGQLEQFASANNLGTDAHLNGYRTRPMLGADGKYKLYEVPDTSPDWHTVKGPDGKSTKIYADPLGVLNYQEKVSQVREANARVNLSYAEAKKDLDAIKDSDTAKSARKELDKVGGDYSKLSPGAKEALTQDAQKRYQLSFNAYTAAQRDMQKDSDWASVPNDPRTGSADTNSEQFKEVAAKYHLDDANEQLGDTYDELRQLGHGYKPFNQQQPGTAAAKVDKNDQKYQAALNFVRSNNWTDEQIDASSIAPEVKAQLKKDLHGNPTSAPNSQLSSIPPSQTLLAGPSGGIQIVDNRAVQTFLSRNPGYKVVGQGTKTQQPEQPYVK